MSKFKWPFDSAITIAIFALILSAAQFLLTTPIFVNFYLHPDLKISGSGSALDSETLVGTFVLRNGGRAPAKNIEVGFVLQENQRILIMPKIKSEIVVTDDSPVLVKNVRLDIPRLNSGEEVVVLIMPSSNGERLNKELVGFMKSSGIKEIPFVSFVRSEHGNGENLTNGINREIEKSNKSIQSTAKAAAY
ncbi:hypothetical protein [Vibrio porteresiae]|uniref:Uncharacterized protein n=1 Tax=Vibrio porteresiae DSM 19223 TaxID=1123496 RepID=A0ABZ0QGW3_9VIBR|nr:hypothetical protein [Vibrio porteresiae]WPC74947.1 hypothetical protein R8Z52_07050 [Vibrio porteresiae DSM 19223]